MEPKYFLLMAGATYYPEGINDWLKTYSSYEEALSEIKRVEHKRTITHGKKKGQEEVYLEDYQINNRNYDWYEIVDLREWI